MASYLKYHVQSGHCIGLKISDFEPDMPDGFAALPVDEAPDPAAVWVNGDAAVPRIPCVIGGPDSVLVGVGVGISGIPAGGWLLLNGALVEAGDAYSFTPDHTGTHTVEAAGQYSSNLLSVLCLGLQSAKDVKWEVIKKARDAWEGGGVDTPFGRFDSDPTSKLNISGAVTGAQVSMAQGQPFSVTWTLADNSPVLLSGADMIQVGMTVLAHVNTAHATARDLAAQIDAATTLAEVEAVKWPLA